MAEDHPSSKNDVNKMDWKVLLSFVRKLPATWAWARRNPTPLMVVLLLLILTMLCVVGAYVGLRASGIPDPLVKWLPKTGVGITNVVSVTNIVAVTNSGAVPIKLPEDPVVARFQASYSGLVARGAQGQIQPRSPYLLESVAVLIRIEERIEKSGKQEIKVREADERVIYNIRGTRTFQRVPDIFRETYASSMGNVFYVPGSDEESARESHFVGEKQINWDVLFDLEAGDSRTVVTGAKFLYVPPFGGGQLHGVVLNTNETAFCYDNDQDLIQECLILVESETIDLRPALDALERTRGNLLPKESHFAERGHLGSTRAVVAARWTNCIPGNKPTLAFRW